MGVAADLRNFANLATGLRAFLRNRITLETATATLRRRLDEREDNFLTTVERTIFSHPASPYRPLLALAGCELGDLRQMVRTKGLDAALLSLRAAGVYFTFEEFKGRQPVVRSGRLIEISQEQFKSPALPHHYWVATGGSTGQGARMSASLARSVNSAMYFSVAHHAYGMAGAPKAVWRGLLPANAGLGFILANAAMGETPRRWFTPLAPGDLTSSRKYPLATYSILALARLYGTPFPWPETVELDAAHVIARWIAETVRRERRCFLSTTASMALRVCLAAKAESLDLTGAMFSGGGEPMTQAKADGIAAVGARARPSYYCTEAGALGMSCANPIDVNEQHLFEDSMAIVQCARPVPGSSRSVDAFNVTTLLPTATPVLLNVELDDYGVIETRRCGCAFETLGFSRHVRHIRSFRKLTGEGVSLVGSDIARVLEDVLPATFGGSPLDYQLSEDEDASGFTRLSLVVSRRVVIPDERAVIDAVLNSLAASGAGADYARATWQKAGTIRIIRAEPVWTPEGKHLLLDRRPQTAERVHERMTTGGAAR